MAYFIFCEQGICSGDYDITSRETTGLSVKNDSTKTTETPGSGDSLRLITKMAESIDQLRTEVNSLNLKINST